MIPLPVYKIKKKYANGSLNTAYSLSAIFSPILNSDMGSLISGVFACLFLEFLDYATISWSDKKYLLISLEKVDTNQKRIIVGLLA